MNTTQWHTWTNQFDSYMLKHRHICVLCIYLHNSTPYLVEALQTLLDLSQDRVWDAYFDFWVLPLGVQTISHNSARITETKGGDRFLENWSVKYGVKYQPVHQLYALSHR